MRLQFDGGLAIARAHREAELIEGLRHSKIREVMHSRKDASAGERLKPRRGVPTWNENTLPHGHSVSPLDRDAMRRVLRSDAAYCRKPARADVFEADETDASHCPATDELRPERRRQKFAHDFRPNSKVHQHPPVNEAT